MHGAAFEKMLEDTLADARKAGLRLPCVAVIAPGSGGVTIIRMTNKRRKTLFHVAPGGLIGDGPTNLIPANLFFVDAMGKAFKAEISKLAH